MRTIRMIAFGALALVSGYALAAAPKLHVSKSVTINAPASKVWDIAKDFDALNRWHPAVASDKLVKGKNNVPGAERELTLKGGGTIHEKLLRFNSRHRRFKYEILESVLPVSNYSSTLVVKAKGKGKCTVTWSGHFKRKDLSDHPADNANDKTAVDTINSVYSAGLDNLKKMAESQ